MKLETEEIKNLIQSPVPTITMHRINYGGKRGYASTEPFRIFSGLTGALSACTFKGNIDNKRIDKWRDKWVKDIGSDGQEAYLNSMADYGSLLHEALVGIHNTGKIVWEDYRKYATEYFIASAHKNGFTPNLGTIEMMVYENCKGAASVLQFVFDNVQEIHAIESMCFSDELGIATPVDAVVTIKDKKLGAIRVCINLKSSSQFGDHQREQIALERFMWNLTYPDFQAHATALLRPKDYKKETPTYEFEILDAVDEADFLKDALSRLRLCKDNPKSTYLNFPKSVRVFSGETKLGETPKIATKTMEELFFEAINR